MHTLSKNLLLVAALGLLLGYLSHTFSQIGRGTDFPSHYSAARMVRAGLGHMLYHAGVQPEYQLMYLGQAGVYHTHPSFEMLIFLPLTALSLQKAYMLWCVLSLVCLVASAKLLTSHVFLLIGWRVLLLLSLLFLPVLLSFMQGQDSVLLLLVLALTFVTLRQRRDFLAGCLLAGGLFRFHVILPLALLLSLRKPKFLGGFLLIAACVIAISMAFSGWTFLLDYPRFLLHLVDFAPATNRPEGMPTMRGLVDVALPSIGFRWPLIIGSSVIIVGAAAAGWIKAQNAAGSGELAELALANAITAGILVGYSVSPHDLTILLIPMLCLLRHQQTTDEGPKWLRIASLVLVTALFLPLLHLWLLHQHRYVFAAIPVVLLFFLTCVTTRTSVAELSRSR